MVYKLFISGPLNWLISNGFHVKCIEFLQKLILVVPMYRFFVSSAQHPTEAGSLKTYEQKVRVRVYGVPTLY